MQKNNRIFLIGVLVIVVVTVAVAVAINYQAIRTTVINTIEGTTGDLEGKVFTDENFNGLMETTEAGIADVQVSIYTPGVTTPLTTTTDAAGLYKFIKVPSGKVRVEFSAPLGYESTKGSATQTAGTIKSLTSVAFVTSPATNVNYGLTLPQKYCQADPTIGMPCNVNGDPLKQITNTDPDLAWKQAAFYVVPNSAKTDPPTETITNILAKQIGVTWGNAFQRSTNSYFTSAVVKRHAGFGPLGIGGIYKITNAESTNQGTKPTTVENFLDVKSIGIDVGSVTRELTGVNTSCPVDASGDLASGTCLPKAGPSFDVDAYGKAGKTGIGGLDLSENEKELWFMNLANRKLYAIDIATKTKKYEYQITNPGCSGTGNDYRPWAVKYNAGNVYVGITCQGDSAGNNLSAYVATITPGGDGANKIVLGPMDLGYARGKVGINESLKWNRWIDNPADLKRANGDVIWDVSNFISYPQAILADLDFSLNNKNIILGFIDRFGNQGGVKNYAPFYPHRGGSDINIWLNKSVRSSGDLLLSYPDPNNPGKLVVENNGTCCGGFTSEGTGNAQGPGGGEMFYSDWGYGWATNATTGQNEGVPWGHDDAALGSFAFNPISRQMIAPVFDLLNPTRFSKNPAEARSFSTGLTWMNGIDPRMGGDGSYWKAGASPSGQANGEAREHAYELYATLFDNGTPGRKFTFGKANGIGDLELACMAAPLEIGNRIWNDANNNGIQDPEEAGIAGVIVKIYQGATLFGETTTDAQGDFYFNDANVNGGLKVNSGYQLKVEADNFATGKPLNQFIAAQQNINNNGSDTIDSDAAFDAAQKIATIVLTTAGPGQNNHTYDFGFVRQVQNTAAIGNNIWIDQDGNGTNNGEQLFTDTTKPITVKLFQGTTEKSSVNTTNGTYAFTNLAPGDYQVSFSVPQGYKFTTKTGVTGTDNDSDADTTTGKTGTITLTEGQIDNTWDAGLVTTSVPVKEKLGDRVWEDANKNGLQDSGEQGISGVTVELFNGGAVQASTTTDATGYYAFPTATSGDLFVNADYVVKFTPKPGYQFTERDKNNNSQDAIDSDANTDPNAGPNYGATIATQLSAGEQDMTWDAGMYPIPVIPAKIGDTVWYDTDKDGIQDTDEAGIGGLKVELFKFGTGKIDETTTSTAAASLGKYYFPNTATLEAGQKYWVQFTLASGHQYTQKDAPNASNSSNETDSDADTTTGRTDVFTFSGQDDLTWDAGMYIPAAQSGTASLGDYVWNDKNKDGIQDANEFDNPDMDGINVTLITVPGNAFVKSAVTGPNPQDGSKHGYYKMTGLSAGTYRLQFGSKTNYIRTQTNVGTNDELDSDVNDVGSTVDNIVLNEGDNQLKWDQGLYNPNSTPETSLTLKKIVINDNGASAPPSDFGLSATGPTSFSGVPDNTTGELHSPAGFEPGTYTLEENGDNSYDASAWTCVGGSLAGNKVTLTSGQSAVCTIINNDKPPKLTLVKRVVNNNGGSAQPNSWILTAQGDIAANKLSGNPTNAPIIPGDTQSGSLTSDGTFKAGIYSLTEGSGPTGYSASTWSCQGAPVFQGNKVEVAIGENVTCTITNDDMPPALILEKVVVNNNGGGATVSGFKLKATGPTTFEGYPTPTNADETKGKLVNPIGFTAGEYTLAEIDSEAGYNASPWTCDGIVLNSTNKINVPPGKTVTCTITNDDIPPKLTLVKQVVNDNGGTARPSAWILTAQGPTTLSGHPVDANAIGTIGILQSGSTFKSGTYVLSESDGQADYSASAWSCVGTNLAADQKTIDIGIGDEATCTITNNDPLTVSIGDFVWNDTNRDGIQNEIKAGLQDVTVSLLQCPLTTPPVELNSMLTSETGAYRFSGLKPGNAYAVHFELPNGYQFSEPTQGGNIETDSDADRTSGNSACVTLGNVDNTTVDAGMNLPIVPPVPASIGDYVWNDADRDGIQDDNESGIAGVIVYLYQGENASAPYLNIPTDADGHYEFNDLAPGKYSVGFQLPDGYQFTEQDKTTDDKDSDANGSIGTIGRTIDTDLAPGENDMNWDAGMYLTPAKIGDYVWEDKNADGFQSKDEPGVNDVLVELYSASNGTGTFVASTKTANGPISKAPGVNPHDGYYEFTDLTPGNYYLKFTPEANKQTYAFTLNFKCEILESTSCNRELNSDAEQTTGITMTTTLNPGEADMTWDAGLVRLATIGNLVWNDEDKDGIQDESEKGISGVTVNLYDAENKSINTTTTNTDGIYLFNNLKPASYSLEFITPDGYAFSQENRGTNDALDSDAYQTASSTVAFGRTEVTFLESGESDLTWDAGMYKRPIPSEPAFIGDFVWNDVNQNGIQDQDELGIEKVVVKLTQCTGTGTATTQTDANGVYMFNDIEAGSYSVQFILPTGYAFSTIDATADDKDSDADKTTGKTICTTLDAGENDMTWDAGMSKVATQQQPEPAVIGDYVWNDTNYNGIQDSNEHGIQNIVVELRACEGNVLATTKTAENGLYQFGNLVAGSYQIKFKLPNGYVYSRPSQGTDFTRDSDANQQTGLTACTTLDAGESDLRWDAGMRKVPSDASIPTTPAPTTPTSAPEKILPVTGASSSWLLVAGGLFLTGIILVASGIVLKRRGGNADQNNANQNPSSSNNNTNENPL